MGCGFLVTHKKRRCPVALLLARTDYTGRVSLDITLDIVILSSIFMISWGCLWDKLHADFQISTIRCQQTKVYTSESYNKRHYLQDDSFCTGLSYNDNESEFRGGDNAVVMVAPNFVFVTTPGALSGYALKAMFDTIIIVQYLCHCHTVCSYPKLTMRTITVFIVYICSNTKICSCRSGLLYYNAGNHTFVRVPVN